MKKFILVGCLLSASMGLNTAFSGSHADQIEVEFNKNNIYEEFTDEIEISNSDKYFVNEETEPDLVIDKGKVEKIENYVVIPKDDFGILASNIKYPDEDYIIADKIFKFTDIDDSLEPFNRRMYAFNTEVDHYVYIPITSVYTAFVPKPVRTGINNFFINLGEITTTFNSILQLRPDKALNSIGRFAINSTIGIGGIFDVAKHAGLKNDPETFGETLGVYGVNPGSYLVVPLTGPTTVRDGVGMIVDSYVSGEVQKKIFDNTIYEAGIEKNVFLPAKTTVQGLNARAMVKFKYGDMNSPFEYDLARAFIYNYRQLQTGK
ncbi:MAG: VacJ family lipoprotein [Fusobacteriales bacterium]|jgi:phospholipid-binding lipoprotein MlaA|nr:VacJ family lipoprotein [Fusobacteriales bacterium]